MMSLVSEQPDGAAGLPFYGLYPRHKSTVCPSALTSTVAGEPYDVAKDT